jgi:hypothetical protein
MPSRIHNRAPTTPAQDTNAVNGPLAQFWLQKCPNSPQKRKRGDLFFIFERAGCPLMRAETFFTSLDVIHRVQRRNKYLF